MKKKFYRLYKCCKLHLQRNNLLCNVCSTFSLNYMAGREGFTPLHDVTLQFIKPGRLRSTFTFKNCNKMPVSKQEQHIYNVIRSNYKPKEILQSFRPNFLKNEKTGKNLEIDIYLPAHRIGFEFQGAIHFKEIEKYKNNPDKSRDNDNIKSGITDASFTKWFVIVEIFEDDLLGDVYYNIIQRCKNTQEYYFDKRYFKKCKIIEAFLQFQFDNYNKYSVKWFELIDKILHYRTYGYSNNLHTVNNLISFYFTDTVTLPENYMYDINRVSQMLCFDRILAKRRSKMAV